MQAVPAPHVAPIVLLLLLTLWYVVNEDMIVITTNRTYLWSFVTQIFVTFDIIAQYTYIVGNNLWLLLSHI
jgi:hypothetical protein